MKSPHLFVCWLGLPLVLLLVSCEQPPPAVPDTGMPWQVERFDDGTSAVFGLRLESTTLAEAHALFGDDLELAVLGKRGGPYALEAYHSRYRAGFVSGKLVLGLQADAGVIDELLAGAGRPEIGESGNRKYRLPLNDDVLSRKVVVDSAALIPSVNLDRAALEARFGPADEAVAAAPGELHLLYPARGIDLVVNEDGKEVFQYVAPRSFARLGAAIGPR